MASAPRERSNLRNGIYSAVVTVLALVGLNALVGMLEEGGVVTADQAFADTPTFLNLDCLIPGGTGQCGLRVGLGVPNLPDFTLDVGGGAGRITFNPVDADMEDDDGWPVPSVDSMSEAAAPAATADS